MEPTVQAQISTAQIDADELLGRLTHDQAAFGRARLTAEQSGRVLACPVLGCPWSIDTTPPATPEGALADVFGYGVVAATHRAQALKQNERDAEQHLKAHTVVEWVTTVRALQAAHAALIGQMVEMTHSFRQEIDRPAIVQAEAASTVDDRSAEFESSIWSCPEGCGYHIKDGPPRYDGDEPTDELIRQHLEEHEANASAAGRPLPAGWVLWPLRLTNEAADAVVRDLVAGGQLDRAAFVVPEAASTVDDRDVSRAGDPAERAVCRFCAVTIERSPGKDGWPGAWYSVDAHWFSCGVRDGGDVLGHEPISPDAPAVMPSASLRTTTTTINDDDVSGAECA